MYMMAPRCLDREDLTDNWMDGLGDLIGIGIDIDDDVVVMM